MKINQYSWDLSVFYARIVCYKNEAKKNLIDPNSFSIKATILNEIEK